MMMVCPNCYYPQKCPCSSCQPVHGYEAPWVWVWVLHVGPICGWCGTVLYEDMEWRQTCELWSENFYKEN